MLEQKAKKEAEELEKQEKVAKEKQMAMLLKKKKATEHAKLQLEKK